MRVCDARFFTDDENNDRFKKYVENHFGKTIFLSNNARRSHGLPFLRKETQIQLYELVIRMLFKYISMKHNADNGIMEKEYERLL